MKCWNEQDEICTSRCSFSTSNEVESLINEAYRAAVNQSPLGEHENTTGEVDIENAKLGNRSTESNEIPKELYNPIPYTKEMSVRDLCMLLKERAEELDKTYPGKMNDVGLTWTKLLFSKGHQELSTWLGTLLVNEIKMKLNEVGESCRFVPFSEIEKFMPKGKCNDLFTRVFDELKSIDRTYVKQTSDEIEHTTGSISFFEWNDSVNEIIESIDESSWKSAISVESEMMHSLSKSKSNLAKLAIKYRWGNIAGNSVNLIEFKRQCTEVAHMVTNILGHEQYLIMPPGMIDEIEPNRINGLLRRCISKCKTFPKEGANVSDGIFVHEESPLEKPKCIYHENRERNDQGVEARPRRIDRTTKKRSVALKQLIEIIDQFQDKLIAWNDQGIENMEQDDAVPADGHESTSDKIDGPERIEVE